MAKSLASFPAGERKEIALKRIQSQTKGLGYWAAMDFLGKSPKN